MNVVAYQTPEVWREAVVLPDALARAPLSRPAASEVVLWQLDLAAIPTEAALHHLPAAERRRSHEWAYRRDFELWQRGRAALRALLARHTGDPARTIRIVRGAGGKPELADNSRDLHFSVARSGSRLLIALGGAPLGVDLVPVRQDFSWRLVAKHWFHAREQEILAAAPREEQPGVFFQIWAHKEACAKAVGGAIDRQSMASFFVPPEGGATHRPEKSWQLWHLTALAAPAGHRASLATPQASPRVTDRSGFFGATIALG